MYDAITLIGRQEPTTLAHMNIIEQGMPLAKRFIVSLGSAFESRSLRNPFTFMERKAILERIYGNNPKIRIVPIRDYPYNDTKWIAATSSTIAAATPFTADPQKIALIGHSKDHSSYYLNLFKRWKSVNVENFKGIDASTVRKAFFKEAPDWEMIDRLVHPSTADWLLNFTRTSHFDWLLNEKAKNEADKKLWAGSPYPVTFVTADAVVTHGEDILLVKRKYHPGKGLWALPGGFLRAIDEGPDKPADRTLLDCALRELDEETSIKLTKEVLGRAVVAEKQFAHPHRSSRGRTITTAFHIDLRIDMPAPKVKAADDAEEVRWFPISELRSEMLFEDHAHIIDHFVSWL